MGDPWAAHCRDSWHGCCRWRNDCTCPCGKCVSARAGPLIAAIDRPKLDVEEGLRVVAAANPGEWEARSREDETGEHNPYVVAKQARTVTICCPNEIDDARAIAWLHNNAPELLRRARECDLLRTRIAELVRGLEIRYLRRDTNDDSVFCEDCGETGDEASEICHAGECPISLVADLARIEKGTPT